MRRQAGVVLPLFSIRTHRDWGIGQITDLPACAEWLGRAGQRLLQVLPPHELSAGETSPYGALTAFGLDPIYAGIEAVEDIDAATIEAALGVGGVTSLERARRADRVQYAAVRELKTRVLRAAFARFYEQEWSRGTARARALASFVEEEKSWLDDLALYTVLRREGGGYGWTTWPDEVRDRSLASMSATRQAHARGLLEVAYVQWTLFSQWRAAHARMRDLGVELMGDLPFIVCAESADVWAHAAQFQLGLSLGAPPDDFSESGQDWGLPVYDWLAMEADGLAWISARARHAAGLYDRFRVDHVVGYFRQWMRTRSAQGVGRFDPDAPDAQRARGRRVLEAMLRATRGAGSPVDAPRVIAEDLGVIPGFVRDELRRLGVPGYRVLPWEKDGARLRDPRDFPEASVASWSTHDTAPIDAWWPDLPEGDRAAIAARAGFGLDARPEVRSLALLRDLYGAGSGLALTLAQELLGLTDRINVPATVGQANWTWRLPRAVEDLAEDDRVRARLEAIRGLVQQAGRAT
jgi:4-alpha-glucanotransferase